MSNNPFEQQPVDPQPASYETPDPSQRPSWMGIVSLVCGGVSLLAWLIPCCGCITGIAGIVFGIMGLKSSTRTLAIIGLILAILGMVGTLINGIWGAYLGATGQHPLFHH